MATRLLYDLAGAEKERRFSPYCWRTRLALAHKGLGVETVPWCFTEKEAIAFSGQGRVPVLVDGERTVADSWAIAEHLEDAYPSLPSLFGGAGGRAVARFVNSWADGVLQPAIARFVLTDIHAHLDARDRDYFRASREKLFGATLEAVCAGREDRLPAFRQSLQPVRTTLKAQQFLGGAAPNYADYIVLGSFQWARCISPFRLLEDDDPVALWRGRMLGLFDGLAGKALGYAA